MSFEINPVLAGKFDTPDATATSNINAPGGSDDITGPDPRRYTQFDRTAIDGAGSTTDFSFSDLLDTINPLEHIPVVSSIYRAITGDTINPVARITGDILYGGAFGVASAVVGGVGAVADTEFEAQTGKDSSGLAMAMLFGPDDDAKNPVQLADADTATPGLANTSPATAPKKIEVAQAAVVTPSLAAALQIPGNAPAPNAAATPTAPNVPATSTPANVATTSASPATPASSATPALTVHTSDPPPPEAVAAAQVAEAAAAPAAASAPSTSPAASAATSSASQSGTIPLLASTGNSPTAKQAFGGIMAPPGLTPSSQPNTQEKDMAVSLEQGAPSMRMGHTIYTNRLMNGRHPLPPMLSTGNTPPTGNTPTSAPIYAPPPVLPAIPTSLTTSSAASPSPMAAFASGGMSSMPPALMQDMMMKALSQYRSVAAGPSGTGGAVNLTN